MHFHLLNETFDVGADMTATRLGYPQRRALRPGAILASIAHAVATLRYAELSHERSWDDENYCVQDSSGSRGVIAFDGFNCVGAFFLESSDRNPFFETDRYEVGRYFAGLPNSLHQLAYDVAMQYMLEDYRGSPTPIITAAFWCDGESECVAAVEPWSVVFENGAQLIRNELLIPEEALRKWESEYTLSGAEATLIQSLFKRRTAKPTGWIKPDRREIEILTKIAASGDGLEAGRESFAELRIRI